MPPKENLREHEVLRCLQLPLLLEPGLLSSSLTVAPNSLWLSRHSPSSRFNGPSKGALVTGDRPGLRVQKIQIHLWGATYLWGQFLENEWILKRLLKDFLWPTTSSSCNTAAEWHTDTHSECSSWGGRAGWSVILERVSWRFGFSINHSLSDHFLCPPSLPPLNTQLALSVSLSLFSHTRFVTSTMEDRLRTASSQEKTCPCVDVAMREERPVSCQGHPAPHFCKTAISVA